MNYEAAQEDYFHGSEVRERIRHYLYFIASSEMERNIILKYRSM